MALIDRGMLPAHAAKTVTLEALIRHAGRCPDCSPIDADRLVAGSLRWLYQDKVRAAVQDWYRVPLRLRPEWKDRIKAVADREHRSVHAQLVTWIERGLNQDSNSPAPTSDKDNT